MLLYYPVIPLKSGAGDHNVFPHTPPLPRSAFTFLCTREKFPKWARGDSNSGPPGFQEPFRKGFYPKPKDFYQPGAPTWLSYGPANVYGFDIY